MWAALNEEQHIGRYLESAFGQSVGTHQLEVILVDGDSRDRTCDVAVDVTAAAGWGVQREPANFEPRTLKILRNPSRTTPSAFNIGASAATGEIVIITGADSELAPTSSRRASGSSSKRTPTSSVATHRSSTRTPVWHRLRWHRRRSSQPAAASTAPRVSHAPRPIRCRTLRFVVRRGWTGWLRRGTAPQSGRRVYSPCEATRWQGRPFP